VTPADALEVVRGLAGAGRFIVIAHARQQMRARGVTFPDLRHGLMHARKCSLQANGRWKVESVDRDGDDLTVAVEIEDGVIVVTVF
jgi:hypothetical protein